jgi:hypothetical protein
MVKFSLNLDASFLKKSYARRIFRGRWRLAVAVIMIGAGVYAARGDSSLSALSVVGLTAIGFAILVYGAAWFRQSKVIDAWIRSQGDAPLIYLLSEDSVETTAVVGSSKLKWDAFSTLSITDEDTLLVFPREGALTLPTRQVPAEAMEFLKQRFLAHGKKITDKRNRG